MPNIPANIESFTLQPVSLNRITAPCDLGPDEARILQGLDPLWMQGFLRRGPGCARTEVTGAAVSVINAFVYTRADCSMGVLDETNGTIRNTPSTRTVACTGPQPLWQDSANSGNSQNIDAGVSTATPY